MLQRTVLALIVAVFTFRAVAGGDTDQKTLQGTWKVTKLVSDGIAEPEVNGFRITFKGNMFSVTIDGKAEEEGTYKLDATKTPNHIDMTGKQTPMDKAMTVVGIYKIEGDTLTVCLAKEATTKRPTAFTSEKGSERTLFTLQRVKK